MPRAGDLFGVQRGSNDLHNPLRGLLDFSNPMGMIGSTAEKVGGQLKTQFDSALDNVVQFIKDHTGIDLTGYATLVQGIGDDISFDISRLAAIFGGIDVTQPDSIVTWLATAPLDAANLLSGIIPGQVIPLLDASQVATGTFVESLIPALGSGWGGTIDASKLVGAFTQDLIPALTSTWGKTIDGSLLAGLLSQGVIPSLTSGWGGTIAGGLLSGLIPTAAVPPLDASILTTGVLLPALVPSLGSGWGGTIASGLLTGVLGQGLIPSLTSGWGGTIASGLLSGLVPAGLIPNLDTSILTTGVLATARAPWAAPIDTLVHAWGGPASGNDATALGNFAALIPFANLQGTLGAADLGTALKNFVTGASQTLQNDATLANQTIQQFQNYFGSALAFLGWNPAGATPANSVAAIASTTQQNQQMRSVQADPNANIDRTMTATFDAKEVYTTATLPTVAVTQNNPVSAVINIRDGGGQKQSIRWKGYVSSGTLSGFYINLYHVDPTTGVWTWFWSSTNYVASLATGSTPQFNSYNITPATAYVNTTQGDMIQAEIVVTGSGTYTMVGKTLSSQWLPMTGVIPTLPGAQRLATTPAAYVTAQANFAWGNGGSGTVTIDQTVADTGAVFVFRLFRTTNQGPGGLTLAGQGFTSVGGGDNYLLQAGSQSFWCEMFYIRNPPAGAQTLSQAGGTGCTNVNIAVLQLANVGTIRGFGQANGTLPNPTYNAPAGWGGSNAVNLLGFAGTGGTTSGTTGYTQSVWNSGSYDVAFGTVAYNAAAQTISMNNGTNQTYGSQWCAVEGQPVAQPTTGYTVANPSAPGTTGVPAVYSRIQPWIGLSGSAGITQYSPITKSFGAGSGQSFNPSTWAPWANHVDVIQWPSGGSGAGGASGGAFGGGGSTPTVTTLTKAQVGTGNWTINVPSGPGGTPPNTNGTAGSPASVVVPSYGTINAPNVGAAGVGAQASPYGQPGGSAAAANYTDANGQNVSFGGGAGGASAQAGGGAPGGGGAGGNSPFYGSYTYGGPGGDGETILRAYQ